MLFRWETNQTRTLYMYPSQVSVESAKMKVLILTGNTIRCVRSALATRGFTRAPLALQTTLRKQGLLSGRLKIL